MRGPDEGEKKEAKCWIPKGVKGEQGVTRKAVSLGGDRARRIGGWVEVGSAEKRRKIRDHDVGGIGGGGE